MPRTPISIATLFLLISAYPAYTLIDSDYRLHEDNTTAAFAALLISITLISYVSAALGRASTKQNANKSQRSRGRQRNRSSRKKERSKTNTSQVISQGAATAKGPRRQGTVKWFNTTKGFGFITQDSGEDIFVHFRSIRGEGHRTLKDGERVDFSVSNGDKGLQADDVVPTS